MDYVCTKMAGEVVMRSVWVRVFSFLLSIINLRALVLVASTLLLYSTCCTAIDNSLLAAAGVFAWRAVVPCPVRLDDYVDS